MCYEMLGQTKSLNVELHITRAMSTVQRTYKLPAEVRKYKAETQAKWRAKKKKLNAANEIRSEQ